MQLTDQRQFEKRAQSARSHRLGQSGGSPVGNLSLPSAVSSEKNVAGFTDGVVPGGNATAETPRPRQIKVTVA
jgi:hypothetical protein